jgi:hypothetical protein
MRTSLRMVMVPALVAGWLVMGPYAWGKTKTEEKEGMKGEAAGQVAYLGIAVESVHPSLWTQLRQFFEHERSEDRHGVLVAQVTAGSPAGKAGIQTHDILMTYGDQKLFNPEQLAGLVRADKAGREVKLGIVRDGKRQDVTVTLGEEEMLHAQRGFRPEYFTSRNGREPGWIAHQRAGGKNDNGWECFDSMTLKNLGDHRYKVEVQYLDKDGKMSRHAFDGTRDEIHNAIMSEKNLPTRERDDLLRALNMRDFDRDVPRLSRLGRYDDPWGPWTWPTF